jgi:hypothetical protein
VRFQVVSATNMETTIFWDFAVCSPVKTDNASMVLTASIIRAVSDPDDGGSKHL